MLGCTVGSVGTGVQDFTDVSRCIVCVCRLACHVALMIKGYRCARMNRCLRVHGVVKIQCVICEDVHVQANPVVTVLGTLRGHHSGASEGGDRQWSWEEMKGRAGGD